MKREEQIVKEIETLKAELKSLRIKGKYKGTPVWLCLTTCYMISDTERKNPVFKRGHIYRQSITKRGFIRFVNEELTEHGISDDWIGRFVRLGEIQDIDTNTPEYREDY